MTESNFCCLCASDEGVFLDIFAATHRQLGNRSFVKEFRTCLSFKVNRDEALSTKICHRCAIELGQCNEFVEHYNQVYEATLGLKKTDLKKYCCLCFTSDKNSCLFGLATDFRSTIDPLQKIYECFNRQITRKQAEGRSICLPCRYNLDVLYDLRKLAQDAETKLHKIAASEAILASLPKTRTFVVNRKTTTLSQSSLEVCHFSDDDSDFDTMARHGTRSKKLKKPKSTPELKFRTCGQCQSSIEGGVDMYRLHSTGLTVCKMCWITMDPFNMNKTTKRKRQDQQETKTTRLCAVFLTDVLSPASSKVNSRLSEEKEGIVVISDDTSEENSKSSVTPKKNLRKERGSQVGISDGESNSNLTTKMKRKSKQDSVDGGPTKKLKVVKKAEPPATPSLRRSSRYQSSDSESVKEKGKMDTVQGKAKNLSKVINVESIDKGKKVKLPNKNIIRKRKLVAVEPSKAKREDSASSSDSGARRSLRKVRNKVPLILRPELPDSLNVKKNVKQTKSRTPVPSKNPEIPNDSNLQSTGKSQTPKCKPSPRRAKSLMMVSFPFKLKDPYECKVCRTKYKNKIVGMKHELTHFKQLKIRIEKLNITRHFQSTRQTSATSELPDASDSLGSTSTNENPPQPELPTSTSPLGSDKDLSKKSDLETEDKADSIGRSRRSASVQQADESVNIDHLEETDAVSSSNGPATEDSTLITNESETKTAENNTAEKSDTKINDSPIENNTSIAEADSVTEINSVDENATTKESTETIDEPEGDEVEKTVDETEVVEDREDKKYEHTALSPSKTTPVKTVDVERDSGEEMESDTDIRIIDSGSSAEDSSEQTEKCQDDVEIVNIVAAQESHDEKLVDEKTETKLDEEDVEILANEPEIDISSTVSHDDHEANVDANDVTLQNEPPTQTKNDDVPSEANDKIENKIDPPNAVNEILQEVIDLAAAEVQKRSVEDEVSFVAETLENISKEIKKTGEETSADAEIPSDFNGLNDKETESGGFVPKPTENS